MRKDIVIAALLLVASGMAQAEVYKWVDANGRVVFSDQPPPGKKVDKVKVYPGGAQVPRQAASAPADAAAVQSAGGLDADVKALNERIEKHNRDVKAQNCKTAQANLAALDRPGSKPGREEMLKRAREEVQIWCGK